MTDGADPSAREQIPAREAWGVAGSAVAKIRGTTGPRDISRDWAWGGSTGNGVRIAVIDSGIDATHPMVGSVEGAVVVSVGEGGSTDVVPDVEGDVAGHGTACAGIIRTLAPGCDLFSVRVLGAGFTGRGKVLLEGLRWALHEGFDVINLSLSTTRDEFALALHELADEAFFRRVILVASAQNMPGPSYPSRFSSVISVASHREGDPFAFFYNPSPPVEFLARGLDVEVAWRGGGVFRGSGNSFAAPHVAAICGLVLSKHPGLTPFQVKSVLYLTASNVEAA